MSTPSTATAVLHPHNFFPRYTEYRPTSPLLRHNPSPLSGSSKLPSTSYYGYSSNKSTLDLGQTASISSPRQIQHNAPVIQTANTPDMPVSKKQERGQTNWREFYKNGVPKEVIVIDDDSPEPHGTSSLDAHDSHTAAASNGVRHADKRRKTAVGTTYDPIYHHSQKPTTQGVPYDDSTSNSTGSAGRTTSANHSTAPTSLASTGSSNLRVQHLIDDTKVGQKRKRATRKSSDADVEEVEVVGRDDAWSSYIPPPKPPIKAPDVHVAVVHDKTVPKNQKIDDDDGHYIVVSQTRLTERYLITKLLGQGTFGKVVEAYDHKKERKVAVKIIRAVQKYRDASRIELRVLSTLASNDKNNRNKCIHLRDCFDYRNHICIVTDLLGQSVFDFLKANSFTPFPSTHIQKFARQLFTSVAFLHDLNLIHTDLKPENILLVNSNYQTFTYNRTIPSSSRGTARNAKYRRVLLDPEIRLIDFGSATFDDEYHSSVVSTRHYRAPEIILNLGWSFPCDIWSIGCILVEFFTGDALFQTHDNLEHLAMMEAVCNGKIDKEIIKQVQQGARSSTRNSAASYFTPRSHRLDYPNGDTPRTSRKYVRNMKKLHETIPNSSEFNNQFLDLLRRIFVYDASKRITAKQALQHPWFSETMQDDGTEALKIRIERERKQRQEQAKAGQTNGYR